MVNTAFLLFMMLTMMLTASIAYSDEPTVTAQVDRNQVAVGDVINLTVVVSGGNTGQVEEPRLGSLKGFELINTSSGTETRSTYVNGRFETQQSRSFNYLLAATQEGTIVIPPITVVVEGKAYATKSVQVAVAKARSGLPQARGAQPRGQQDPFDEMDQMEELFNQMLQRRMRPGVPPQQMENVNPNEAFFIQGDVDKTKAFVGEQVTVSFYLYTRGQIRDIDTLKYPDLRGFWKEELEMATRLNFEQVTVNGLAYQRALLVSYALFPIKAGKAIVDPYKAKCTVLTASNFGFGRAYQFTKSSKPVQIEVLDVPTINRPTQFTGAVGIFRVKAQFEPPTGVTNQPVTLRVRVEGQGNAKLIELPKLGLPESFELYDQKSQAKFLKDGTSFKEFEVLIIPREPGVFEIPPVEIGVFEPSTQKFQNIKSQALNLSVTGVGQSASQPSPNVTAPAKKDDEPTLPPLATEWESPLLPASTETSLLVILYSLIFSGLGFYAWKKLRSKPKKVSLRLVLAKRLGSIRALANKNSWRQMGVELTNAVYYILGQISEQGGANQELMRVLEHCPPSLRAELSKPIQNLLAKCEALSFAPEAMVGDMTQKNKTVELISEFESVMSRAIELAEN